jgi:uncharacterized protein with GYD domain
MVRYVSDSESPEERLERLVRAHASQHGLRVEVTGWTRKTFDVFQNGSGPRDWHLVSRIESFATVSGEVRIFSDAALPFAEALAADLEQQLDAVAEASIIREDNPVD